MMEVDLSTSYIFGSFSRRRQGQEASAAAKRRSIEQPPAAAAPRVQHDRSRSTPHATPKRLGAISPAAAGHRAKSVCGGEEPACRCPVCQRHYVDPRVLPCLHTFCGKCLQELEVAREVCNGSDVSSGSANGSGGSGYASDRQEHPAGENAWVQVLRSINCPLCGSKCELPNEGIRGLPPNYLVQHRMVLATLNAHTTKLLCDLCPTDTNARWRCSECALSLCDQCGELHRRQRIGHEVLDLEEARRKGITKVRRQVMCTNHPEKELSAYCSSCTQVVCRDCVSASHRNHSIEPATKAAKVHTTGIRMAIDRAKSASERTAMATSRLEDIARRVDSQCDHIQTEIEKFTENYIKSVQEHQKNLYRQLGQARSDKLRSVGAQRTDLHKKLRDARDAVNFANELLKEGTDVEVLSFVGVIMKRLEQCYKLEGAQQELKVSESLQFLPEEAVVSEEACCPLYGVITTQTVSVKHCVVHTDGLQNLRVGRRGEVILETRDRSDAPLQRGGEHVTAELKHRDANINRNLQVNIEDQKDGTYRIYFNSDVAGKLLLSIYIRGQPTKESPIPVLVRSLRPHHGTFHCCSFCSSGGSKEAACGCGGRMPGGYRGCGHGHDGHPGRRHWSCCGNVLEHSECSRTNSVTHYQFTL